jgi:hypothetical protein
MFSLGIVAESVCRIRWVNQPGKAMGNMLDASVASTTKQTHPICSEIQNRLV